MSASQQSRGTGVDLPTLAITAAASAAAAYVCSQIWAPGTLGAAATMPVLVALLKEAFSKPAEVVTRAVPVRGVVRSARREDEPYEPVPAVPPESERVSQAGEIPGASRAYRTPSWKAAVVTGLLGFVIAAVIITVPEFVAGKSAAGGDRGTTLFGGEERSSSDDDDEEKTETTAPTETQGVPPASTVTVPPVETTTVPAPTTTVAPAETTPAPPPQPPPATTPQPPPAP